MLLFEKKKRIPWLATFGGVCICMLLGACGGGKASVSEMRHRVDSLNRMAYVYRYRDLDYARTLAVEACECAAGYRDGKAVAMNSLGFVALMELDFDEAMHCYREVQRMTNNQIECLVADVGLMKVYQRTSANREFYDQRTRALKRIGHIREEEADFSELDRFRFRYALSDFHMVSAVYQYALQQHEKASEEMNCLVESDELRRDTSQWMVYAYLKGMGLDVDGDTYEARRLQRYFYLNNCLRTARAGGYTCFEGMALLGLSELFEDAQAVEQIADMRPNSFGLLWDLGNAQTEEPIVPEEAQKLSRRLAQEALVKLLHYGDMYHVTEAYRLLAANESRLGDYRLSLQLLQRGLDLINDHYLHSYMPADSVPLLQLFQPGEELPVELSWLAQGVRTIPDVLCGLREQASVAFSGLGDKVASDYNRNIYLDLLEMTRQDKELESRYQLLRHRGHVLNGLFAAVLGSMMAFFALFIVLSRRWRKRNRFYVEKLTALQGFCRKIINGMPTDAEDSETVSQWVTDFARSQLIPLLEIKDLLVKLDPSGDEKECTEKQEAEPVEPAPEKPCFCEDYLLQVPDDEKQLGTLSVSSDKPFTRDQRAMLRVVVPYLAMAIENGMLFALLGDRQRAFEKERYLHQMHIATNKRENVIRKASFSIVLGITPYIDRTRHEVHKLLEVPATGNEMDRRGKYQYISELTNEINGLNEILSQWIKTRQGLVNLHLESFALEPLFVILDKSRHSYEQKQLTLEVKPTSLQVRADKALTFFMINTLADNARKFTPAGGSVSVEALEHEDCVEISVTDTGIGLSQVDIARILGEKVYDSRLIGNRQDCEQLKNKGSGFGLLNCKGIIEKYRKTDTLFQVCRFGIESTVGKGSRFFFRLPKGIVRALALMLLFLPWTPKVQATEVVPLPDSSSIDTVCLVDTADNAYDPLLEQASTYADSVYYCNLRADYAEALAYADSSLHYLNRYACQQLKDSLPSLTVAGRGQAQEIRWWLADFETDYYTILDIRNELAVAYLALCRWEEYRYNNQAYTDLYKLISEDSSLSDYCDDMQRYYSNMIIAVILCGLLLVLFLIVYFVLYFRHKLLYRISLEQVFDVNRQLLDSSLAEKQRVTNPQQLADNLVLRLYKSINDLLSVDVLSIAVYDEEAHRLCRAVHPTDFQSDTMEQLATKCYEQAKPQEKAQQRLMCFPLMGGASNERLCVGVLTCRSRGTLQENDRLMAELVAAYLGVVVYNMVVRLAHTYRDIEVVEDEARRALHEENRLHVQNMVLDNCLSTIKHETVYYPNKIRQIVDRLITVSGQSEAQERDQVKSMGELIDYYKDVFTTLSDCAMRQLDEVTFRRSVIGADELTAYADSYFHKLQKHPIEGLQLEIHTSKYKLLGDEYMLKFLLECLLNDAFTCSLPGTIQLSVTTESDFVRFGFTDTRRTYSREELNNLFYPSITRLYSTDDGTLKGTEYVICKQVIREHDEYFGHVGCRIKADCPIQGSGFTVWFTVPKA